MRLRLSIRAEGGEASEVALLNSGYEAPTPQLMVPISTARKLGLWPPAESAKEVEVETAGGPLRVWYYPRAASVKVVASDGTTSREVLADVLVSPLADEPLISDALAEELELVVEAFGRGLWRFRWDPPGKLRRSEQRAT